MKLNDVNIQERATFYFSNRYHCSQAVLQVVQELMGRRDEDAVRMMSGFGGGFGGAGSVCGAISGGVAALGLAYGRGKLEERDAPRLFPLCAELYRRFGEEIETSCFCRDITGVDFGTKEGAKAFYGSPEKLARCARLVAKTAEMVRDMLAREEQKPTTAS